ncbi:MAG: glycosyltransferase family 2 protein [Bacteroidales bacterium]|nr:glycosyltransferase family 2 protein [Bacteroidales bacterium]
MNNIHISVVTPVHGCNTNLEKLYERLLQTLLSITKEFEILMVNDASLDNAWDTIKQLSKKDKRVKGINFSRNFGQHKAITAGLDYAHGDWVIVMDCDLQDKPEEILKLYNKAQEGYDIVFGKRAERQDKYFKKLASKIFYKIYDYLTGYDTDHSIANFSIISQNVVKNFRKMGEQHKPYGYFVNWLGFKRTNIDIEHAPRLEGKSSYTLKKLIDLATDNIISQSNKPLRMSIKFGFLMSFFSAGYAIYLIFQQLLTDISVPGWTSVMVSIYFVAGLILVNLGFLGLYIGKIFDETKRRPLYVISETTFSEDLKE